MIIIESEKIKIEEIQQDLKSDIQSEFQQATTKSNLKPVEYYSTERPEVVDAKVYKMRSAFVNKSVFITLGYYKEHNNMRPIEIFINSKDLSKAAEYIVLTRLISAIFRRSPNPHFILEELRGIVDPNGGSYTGGKYYDSFYAEIADVIEQFFFDVGILCEPDIAPVNDNGPVTQKTSISANDEKRVDNFLFRICPECNQRTLKTENGCDICLHHDCGYSKCDK